MHSMLLSHCNLAFVNYSVSKQYTHLVIVVKFFLGQVNMYMSHIQEVDYQLSNAS